MLLIRSRRSCPVVFPLNFLVLLRFSSGLWIPDWYVTYRMSIQKRGFDQLPSWDDELPMLFDFETNIRLVGLTSNFQLARTFTFFFTIFTQIYVFLPFFTKLITEPDFKNFKLSRYFSVGFSETNKQTKNSWLQYWLFVVGQFQAADCEFQIQFQNFGNFNKISHLRN